MRSLHILRFLCELLLQGKGKATPDYKIESDEQGVGWNGMAEAFDINRASAGEQMQRWWVRDESGGNSRHCRRRG